MYDLPLVPFYDWIDTCHRMTRAARMFECGIIEYSVELGYKNDINEANALASHARDISILHIEAYMHAKHFPAAPPLDKLVT